MISKKFFVSNAREPTKRWIRQNVSTINIKVLIKWHVSLPLSWDYIIFEEKSVENWQEYLS